MAPRRYTPPENFSPRRPCGRPRKASGLENHGPSVSAVSGAATEERYARVMPVAPVPVRLLDLEGAASYLAVSPWTIRDLEAQGILPRVRIPLPGDGELRKILFDRADLDALIERSKERTGSLQ